ncbi:hypothetical protein [Thermoflexus sp.]|uniref:hypothetical protein n=1 Tax=Thermoflexus sp. TaxID=1969742 RepID=UPI0025F63F7F|nr:hypothetical protein [Thermoflexus sp.]MCS7351636.1 beta/gamma crystallin family protein [Thermoflexus sp.]MCX7691195.1 beta/gamma crystallin family protein [Thermoflexus sp.]MDW8181094.1 hypothetical protein [Anaerolineae bacterium]
MRRTHRWRWIAGLGVVAVALGGLALIGLGAAARPSWGDPAGPVWYYGRLVPIGERLARGVEPKCHDGLGPGILTCYDTNEELAAATGLDLPGVDRARVEQLRQSGAVVPVGCAYYAVLWEHASYGGRNFVLCYDYNDLRSVHFNDIASSIFIPSGAGVSAYFEHINFGGDRRTFTVSIPDLQVYSFNDRISSARRGD